MGAEGEKKKVKKARIKSLYHHTKGLSVHYNISVTAGPLNVVFYTVECCVEPTEILFCQQVDDFFVFNPCCGSKAQNSKSYSFLD